MTNLPPNFPPPPPGGPIYGQHLPPGWENRNESDFWDAFDFSFESYATPAVVKVVYMLIVIFCVLTYAGNAEPVYLKKPPISWSGMKIANAMSTFPT